MNDNHCAPTSHYASLPSRCTQTCSFCPYCELVYGDEDSSAWTLSTSSSLTASNLVGAGRTLGNAYGHLGRRLERALSQFMSKRGFGPSGTATRINSRAQELEKSMDKLAPSPLKGTQRNTTGPHQSMGRQMIYSILIRTKFFLLRRDCIRLLKYAESHVVSTQIQALKEISKLSEKDAFIRELFHKLNAHAVLACVRAQARKEIQISREGSDDLRMLFGQGSILVTIFKNTDLQSTTACETEIEM